MTGSWGMNPDGLDGAGSGIQRLVPEASTGVSKFRTANGEAAAAVHHPLMKTAIDNFDQTWSTPCNRLVHNVDAAGSQVRGTAGIGVETDSDSCTALEAPLGEVEAHRSVLAKNINIAV